MMLRKKDLVVACAMMVFGTVHGNAPLRMGNYDFSYEATGAPKVMPIQVFDDGKSTYFQFRAGEAIPAIFVNGPTGPEMQVPEMEGPYARVSGVASRYMLRIGYGVGQVAYSGERAVKPTMALPEVQAGQAPQVGAQNPQSTPGRPSYERLNSSVAGGPSLPKSIFRDEPSPRIALELNSYATPIKGDLAEFPNTADGSLPSRGNSQAKIEEADIPFAVGVVKLGPIGRNAVVAQARAFTTGTRVEVMGRDDSSTAAGLANKRAESVVELLVKSGVPRDAISLRAADKFLSTKIASATLGVAITMNHPSPFAVVRVNKDAPHAGFREASINTWTLKAGDATVQRVLQRWADDAGWRLVWKDGPEIKITGDAELVRDGFVSAADYLLVQSRSSGHNIKGRAYSNKVLVVSSD